MIHEPMRAQTRSLVMGCVLAIVGVAGCLVVAFVRPADALGDASVVMVKESGALYVRVGDTWHPVLNLASARLIAGTPATPQIVRESELRKTKRGVLLGIPGAPAVIPEPLSAAESLWTVCDNVAGTTVIGGVPSASAAQSIAGGRTMLVRSGSDTATYLLYDGRRARVRLTDDAVVRALRLDAVEPVAVSSAVLNAIPEAPPITTPAIPGAGTPGPASLGVAVGTVVRVARADTDELYVVLADGVQRVGRVAADVVRFTDSQGAREIVTVAADAISTTPSVERLRITTFPDTVDPPVRDDVVCARWLPGGDSGSASSAVLTSSAVPLTAGQVPVALAQADGSGPNVDAVFVPPGRCLYVQSSRLYLVLDTGVRFAIADAQSAAALGLSSQPVPAPWVMLKLLADAPELNRAAALLAHDGVAATAAPR